MKQLYLVAKAGTIWNALDNSIGNKLTNYIMFAEADFYLINFQLDASWKHVATRFTNFRKYYNESKSVGVPSGARADAKAYLQDVFLKIPYVEMLRNDYKFYVEAPRYEEYSPLFDFCSLY